LFIFSFWLFVVFIELLACDVIMGILSLQEEFQLAIFKNKKKENIFANRVLYIILLLS